MNQGQQLMQNYPHENTLHIKYSLDTKTQQVMSSGPKGEKMLKSIL